MRLAVPKHPAHQLVLLEIFSGLWQTGWTLLTRHDVLRFQ